MSTMTPGWLYNRLRAMSLREIGYRVIADARERLQSIGVGNAQPGSPSPAEGKPWVGPLPEQFAVEPIGTLLTASSTGIFKFLR